MGFANVALFLLQYEGVTKRQSHPAWVRGLKLRNVGDAPQQDAVAPCVGAWIETMTIQNNAAQPVLSHPAWVRGLKPLFADNKDGGAVSHPAWVRGLKPGQSRAGHGPALSHPAWVRGLKP